MHSLWHAGTIVNREQMCLLHHYHQPLEQWIHTWVKEPKSESKKQRTKPHKFLHWTLNEQYLQQKCSYKHTTVMYSNLHKQLPNSDKPKSKQFSKTLSEIKNSQNLTENPNGARLKPSKIKFLTSNNSPWQDLNKTHLPDPSLSPSNSQINHF